MTQFVTRGKRILLIEDDQSSRESIKLLLTIDRHQVTEAADGAQGLALLAQQPFDVVVLDFFMPGMDGGEVARQIKQMSPSVPILMVTAYLEKLSGADRPVDAVLGKPFAMEDLRTHIAALLTLPRN